MASIRLALVDMDGTLLGSDQIHISQRNMRALHLLHERGIEVVPCTGRVVDMLPPQLLALPWMRYVVSSHGARVYDRVTERTLYENLLSPKDSAAVLRAIEGRGLYAEIAAEHTIYIEKDAERIMHVPPVPPHHKWYMIDWKAYTAVPCLSEHFLAKQIGIEKVNIYGIPNSLVQNVYDDVTATGVIRHTRGAANVDLEFSAADLNKGRALETLLAHLNLGYEETFAIGDSSTDESAIRAARVGVAMGNAPEAIRAAADFVTASNVQDGFAKAVERLLGEGSEE